MKRILKTLRKQRKHSANQTDALPNGSSAASQDTHTPSWPTHPDDTALKCTLNLEKIDGKTLVKQISALLVPRNLTTIGGILFKAGISGGVFHIGVVPNFHDGERGYHYNITLPDEDVFTLIGGINPQGKLTILFKNSSVDEKARSMYRREYSTLARLLLACCQEQPLTYDWITKELIEEQQLFTEVPESLEEMVSRSGSHI